MADNKNKCGDCALYASGLCRMTGLTVNAETDYCSKCVFSLQTCDLCGQETLNVIYDITNPDKILKVCQSCSEKSGTCATCKHGAHCAFNEDPSPLPKMVQKQSRQGNMISVMTVPNPERMRETCLKNCDCGSEEFGCMRKNVGCCDGKWEQIKL